MKAYVGEVIRDIELLVAVYVKIEGKDEPSAKVTVFVYVYVHDESVEVHAKPENVLTIIGSPE